MLVIDGVGTARGVGAIERGVFGLGLAARGAWLIGFDKTTVCIVPIEALGCGCDPFWAPASGGSGSASSIARAEGKRFAIS
jgi:hypothetical protein